MQGEPHTVPPGTRQAPPEKRAKLAWEITINSKQTLGNPCEKKQMYELEHKT